MFGIFRYSVCLLSCRTVFMWQNELCPLLNYMRQDSCVIQRLCLCVTADRTVSTRCFTENPQIYTYIYIYIYTTQTSKCNSQCGWQVLRLMVLSVATVMYHWWQMNEIWVYCFGGKSLLGKHESIYRKACFSVPYLQIRFLTKPKLPGVTTHHTIFTLLYTKRLDIEG